MLVVCSYCGVTIGEKPSRNVEGLSHGMCDACFAAQEAELDRESLDDFLARTPLPVLAVDPNGRVIGANRLAEAAIGKSFRDYAHFRGGEVFDCRNAAAPQRCGQAPGCAARTVRNTVMAVHETGQPQRDLPVELERPEDTLRMVISVEPADSGEYVVLTLKDG